MDQTDARSTMLHLARSVATTTFVAALWFAAASPAHAQDTDNDGIAGAADPCPTDARNRCAGSIAIDTVTGLPIRVNANSTTLECAGAKLDCAGDVWAGDFGFNTGSNSRCNIGGTGEACVINGITTLFGCDNEETEDLFQCERYDPPASPELTYSFNVPNSRYIVNLFFASTYTGTAAAGQRIFDIYVEGALKYDNFDQVVAAGGSGIVVVRSVDVNVTDGNGLQIQLVHQLENPSIKAIEVIAVGGCTSNSQCNDSNPCTTDTCLAGACQFSNNNATCNDGLSCTSNDVCSSGSCSGTSNCPSGQTCNVQSGVCDAPNVSFGKSLLQGETITKATALQFGPDGKLYVAQQNGVIHVYTITRPGPDNYVASNTQIINLVNSMPNRNDDGSVSTQSGRLVTGIFVAGTAQNPIIYVASADPRIGGGSTGTDKNLDTNSGIISRLTWNGSAWQKLDLVRGLPRSEENHQGNGIYVDTATNILYLAYGGNTNMGAPSNNFAGLPEVALSAAILSVDLAAIGNSTYDIPTLDDEDATNVCTLPAQNFGLACAVNSQCDSSPGSGNGRCTTDWKDPFGGNNGKNQAKLVAGGPVQVYAPGFRNPYDVIKTASGRMYTIDNGSNGGWGNMPAGEGSGGACTNAISEPGTTHRDGLHYVTGAGYYGGHPNPTRARTANTFNASNPQSPVPAGNPVECDYRTPGAGDGSLWIFTQSTNGITEFTTNHFGGQMTGNLLAASLDNQIWRIQLNGSGTAASNVAPLFSTVGTAGTDPLDVYASKATDPFPGTIWVAEHSVGEIIVYEPASSLGCTGADNPGIDEDGDSFNNADEIDNGTDPCSSADIPGDWDHDFVSDLNDADDDNDGILDTSDKFALDPDNGKTTAFPLLLGWENDDPPYGGIMGLGFTGLMTNGTSNYLSLFNPDNMTAGGAAGVTTVDSTSEGDALGNLNTQQFAFQLGIDPSSGGASTFTVRTRIVGPFVGTTAADFQSMGLFIGTGDQDNYFKVVTSANGGAGGVATLLEVSGVATAGPTLPLELPGPEGVDLYLTVDRTASTVQAGYAVTHLGTTSAVTPIGSPVAVPSAWLTNPASGLAVGVIATSRGAAPPFPATWDFIEITNGTPSCTSNSECDDDNACSDDVCNGGTCTNTPLADGTACSDDLACTIADVCTDGICGGSESCPLYQGCDSGTGACATVSGDPDRDGLAGATDPCPGDPRNLCYGPVAIDGTTQSAIRINANSSATAECAGAKTDCNGDVWSGDAGFNTGTNLACNLNGGAEACVISGIDAIFGCDDESTEDLFQCERYDPAAAPELQYSFNVVDGEYLVNLYFANTYTGTTTGGSRVFDIQIEGSTVYNDFDQIVAAGGSSIAVVRSAITNVSDGNGLQIQFLHAVENPSMKAIEVLTSVPACTIDSECNDGNACNGVETCNPTVGCIAGTPLTCNDGNACNGTETCDEAAGCVGGTQPTCDDGNVCNGTETCNTATGCMPGTPLSCNDGNACNGLETCDTTTGCVTGTPLSCNDGNACNGTETCDTATGCVTGTPLSCNDGNACNGLETCDTTTGCVTGTPLSCNDGNACNGLETCDTTTGCVTGTPLSCNDDNACNGLETCLPASGCQAGTPLDCSDGDPCTADTCTAGTCVHGGCDDGNACNGNEACDTGTGCVPGTPLTCDDGDACNGAETCDTATGCQSATPLTCDDGDACNGIESCLAASGCQAGTPLDCSDGDPCTTDTCTAGTCVHGGCDDGNACNGSEACETGTGCVPGTPLSCNDGDACNGAETCDAALGCQSTTPLTCDDGNACNGAEACDTGTGCVPGTPLSCNDGDACNGLESCFPASGCQPGAPLDCSDGDPCTTDTCSGGSCVHSGSCPPTGNVSVDAASVRTACVGTAANSITLTGVPVGSQADRILVVTVGAEENDADCDLSLGSASATYGGIVMSKAVTRVSNTASWRTCNAIFYQLNPPTGTANVVINFPTTTASAIDNRQAGAFVIYNAAQQAPEVTATAGANASTNPVNTAIAPPTAGGVLVDVITRGNTGSYTTTQAGQVEQWDLSCTSSSSATSIKPVTSPGQTLLGWTHTNPNRYAHALAAFAPSGVAVTTSTTSTTTTTGTTTTTLSGASDAAAFVTITPTGGINASTFNPNAYNVRNDSPSGQSITQVRVEFADTLLPDLVFDPAGTAGDLAASCLSASSNAAATGFVAPANPCTTPFSVPYELGYRAIDLFFTDFDPGETFGFAADADPTSIRGTSGQGGDSTGSVSGLELTGATVTIWFDDGSQIAGETFSIPGSLAGSQNVIKAAPPAAPTIAALNVATPATVASPAQTIRVSGPVGASVRLLRVQAELGLNGGTGYDLDPFEANSVVALGLTNGTIGGAGFVDIPVTLTRTSGSSDLNYFAAVVLASDGSGQTSAVSNVVVVEYVPPTGNIAVDAVSVRTACVGTAGDSITLTGVPVGSQPNRILVVTVGAEEGNLDCNLGLASASATYGGTVMTKAITRVSHTTSTRTCNGIFYMLNPPTGTADVVINLPTTGNASLIDNRHAGAFVLYNAAQQAPEVTATAGASANTNPVNTAIAPLTAGGVLVDVITRGNTGSSTTTQTGQIEQWDLSCTSSSSATSVKPVASPGQTLLGWSHTNPTYYAHSLAAFRPAP